MDMLHFLTAVYQLVMFILLIAIVWGVVYLIRSRKNKGCCKLFTPL